MKNRISLILLFLAITVFFSSCLTCEKKDYVYVLNKDGSISLTINFINILSSFSQSEDGATPASVAEADYQELMNDYIKGSKAEGDYGDAVVETKRLYEENGKLNGQLVLKFKNLEDAKLYTIAKEKYLVKEFCTNFNETLVKTNGESPTSSSIVVWDANLTTLTYSTSVAVVEGNDGLTSLLSKWKKK